MSGIEKNVGFGYPLGPGLGLLSPQMNEVWIFLSLSQPRQMSLVDEQLPLWSIIVVEEQLGLASKAEELGSSCCLVWGSLMQKEYSSILSITGIRGSCSSQKVWFGDH